VVTFDFATSANLKFGIDIINRIGNVAAEFGDKAILVTEGILHESGTINRVVEIIKKKGCEVIIFDDVTPNSMSDIVDYGTELAKSSYANVLIGMGGIRALSIAKAVAMLKNNPGDISDYIDGAIQEKDSMPYIEIPSTPRNPFMFRDELWLVNAKNRNSTILKVKKGTTKHILFDPMITTTLPRRFTATTSIYTLANAIEGYISSNSNFFSDTLFLKSIELIKNNIFQAVDIPDDINSRANLGLAGLLTSLGLNMASTGIASAVSYVLSGKYRIHKSLSISVLLPHIMNFNITTAPVKFVKLAETLGEDITNLSTVEAAVKAIENIKKMIIKLQLPVRLSEFELNKDDLITVADDAKKFEMFNYVPRSCSSEELYEILLTSF
jgi:alcohol dehydrogenase class IV